MSHPRTPNRSLQGRICVLMVFGQACQPGALTDAAQDQSFESVKSRHVASIEGSWSGELIATSTRDAHEISDTVMVGLFQVHELDPDLSDFEFDLSTRFDDGSWWTGYGLATPMSAEQGRFEAIVDGPGETSCHIEGDWFSATEQLFMAFRCNSWEGELSEYELDAGRF